MAGLDVSGWLPAWSSAEQISLSQSESLRRLIGRRLVSAWIVWNLDSDEWFADLPVVLQFDQGPQLEVCWQKFDELSITWDTIDVTLDPHAWVSWPLEWRSQAQAEFDQVAGQDIVQIETTSHLFTTQVVGDPSSRTSVWLTSGLWLQTQSSGLHIFNALDENGLSNEPPLSTPELRHWPI